MAIWDHVPSFVLFLFTESDKKVVIKLVGLVVLTMNSVSVQFPDSLLHFYWLLCFNIMT